MRLIKVARAIAWVILAFGVVAGAFSEEIGDAVMTWAGCGLTTLILLLLASIAESLHKLAEKGDATG
jgi:hypothetical protein